MKTSAVVRSLLFFFSISITYTQAKNIGFSLLRSSPGISMDQIAAIVQDKREFLGLSDQTNLSIMCCVFRLRGADSRGIWNNEGVRLKINILPPWWKTFYAYLFYGLSLAAGIFFVDRHQRRKVIEKERSKTRDRELAQAKEIEKAYTDLKATQSQLIQSEKMASLGELTAGIAHEIQNPLNFVNNFSEVCSELLEEMNQEIQKGDLQEIRIISNDLKQNLEKISHHGRRASSIVKSMLNHSRASSGEKIPTDLNALCEEFARLAYHGFRAKDKSFNANYQLDLDPDLPRVDVVSQDIGRVLLNLINNAFQACLEKQNFSDLPRTSLIAGGAPANTSENLPAGNIAGRIDYKPLVSISTKRSAFSREGKKDLEGHLLITISDNGPGIPEEIKDKIFQPFFTTKASGHGTGLGLSLSYDIIKTHGGLIEMESEIGQGTEFIIKLLLNHSK